MLKIRLQRVGKKHDPSFRIVLVDSRRGPKSGNFLEILGSYNAQRGNPQFKAPEKIKELISKGAQVSGTVNNLLVKAGILKRDIIDVSAKNKKRKEEATPAPVEAKPLEGKATPATEESETEEASATPEEKPAELAKEEAKPEDKPAEPAKKESKPKETEKEESA